MHRYAKSSFLGGYVRKQEFGDSVWHLLGVRALEGSTAGSSVESPSKCSALYGPIHNWAINSSAKYQRMARVGPDHKMPHVDRAGDAARLICTLEVALDAIAVLFEVKVLGRGCSVRVVAVKDPLAGSVRRCRRFGHLLRPCGAAGYEDKR